jgi:hypothetical protein
MTKKVESHGTCEVCAKACEDAKENVKKLQKKLQTMTIVTCVSITLGGEQVAKSIVSYITSYNEATKAAEGKTPTVNKDDKKGGGDGKIAISPFRGPAYKFGLKTNIKEDIKYKPEDELARFAKKPIQQKPILEEAVAIVPPSAESVAIAKALSNDTQLGIMGGIAQTDWRTVLLTPSTLPFDVYSTTVGLGYNYGFGEYYGLGEANAYSAGPSVPSPSSLSVFAIAQLFNTRKRI